MRLVILIGAALCVMGAWLAAPTPLVTTLLSFPCGVLLGLAANEWRDSRQS
jgi:hypothetical protein